jgi:hypothetical protein
MATLRPIIEVSVPLGYPTSQIYMDESGSRASGAEFFVLSAVKVRRNGAFARSVKDIRDQHNFDGEFKFSRITSGTLDVYYALVDEIEKADINFAAGVVDGTIHNPFGQRAAAWRVHADLASKLLVGCINKRELVSVLMDGISTPKGIAIDDVVMGRVNKKLGSISVITATCLDSRTCDGLQVADLLAGAVAHDRRNGGPSAYRPQTPKAKVVNRLKAAFGGIEFVDGRGTRYNIKTFEKPKRAARRPATPAAGVGD